MILHEGQIVRSAIKQCILISLKRFNSYCCRHVTLNPCIIADTIYSVNFLRNTTAENKWAAVWLSSEEFLSSNECLSISTELDVTVHQWLQRGLWQLRGLIRRNFSGLCWLKLWACHQRCVRMRACQSSHKSNDSKQYDKTWTSGHSKLSMHANPECTHAAE